MQKVRDVEIVATKLVAPLLEVGFRDAIFVQDKLAEAKDSPGRETEARPA